MNINKKGFSLVELMIVVAIIGVLTAIAIPNFQAFQARSRQSEAKAGLSAIHTAEHAFHSEWEVYAGALEPIGWVPENKEFRYAIGFAAAQAPFCGAGGTAIAAGAMLGCGPAPGRVYRGDVANPTVTLVGGITGNTTFATSTGAMHGITFVGVTTASTGQGAQIASGDSALDNVNNGAIDEMSVTTDVNANSFTAGAVGNPFGYSAATEDHYDYWSIDENKQLEFRLGSILDDDL